MFVFFCICMYILYKHTGPDYMSHPSHMAIQKKKKKKSAQEYKKQNKIKNKNKVKQLANHLKTTPGKGKKKKKDKLSKYYPPLRSGLLLSTYIRIIMHPCV